MRGTARGGGGVSRSWRDAAGSGRRSAGGAPNRFSSAREGELRCRTLPASSERPHLTQIGASSGSWSTIGWAHEQSRPCTPLSSALTASRPGRTRQRAACSALLRVWVPAAPRVRPRSPGGGATPSRRLSTKGPGHREMRDHHACLQQPPTELALSCARPVLWLRTSGAAWAPGPSAPQPSPGSVRPKAARRRGQAARRARASARARPPRT